MQEGLDGLKARRTAVIANLAFGLAALAASGLVWWQAGHLPPATFDPLGPATFPRLVSLALGALALVLIGRVVFGYRVGESDTSLVVGLADDGSGHRQRWALLVGIFLALLVYIASFTLLNIGFMWSTIAFLAVAGFAMSDRRPRDLAIAAAVAVIVGVALAYLFKKILFVDLP